MEPGSNIIDHDISLELIFPPQHRCFLGKKMAGGLIAEIPKPKRIHVILSKLMGGTMVFWVLWRLKHDWQEIVGHKYVFEKEDEEKAKQKHGGHH